jgi:ferredoxin
MNRLELSQSRKSWYIYVNAGRPEIESNPREEQAMVKTVWVDQGECISCGLCIESAPEVFRFADSGKSEAFNQLGASQERIQTAVDGCPVSCIHWKE